MGQSFTFYNHQKKKNPKNKKEKKKETKQGIFTSQATTLSEKIMKIWTFGKEKRNELSGVVALPTTHP